ncbi:hypothetical protein DZC30_00760 [Comamonas testosteroni]|uniref:Uncharacterized protein n=1 Tax=Comamonas testosteroni TaxID=285 RepID=A0A373FS37_COMTE|nr:hypothetical protein [Comamonas testosteroni]RGE46970.1 hypothetical protein DZC30_00760 [Comamonas testosteroni]
MPGQLIILPGVNAGGNGGARIDMNTADQIAARMPDLKHVISARSLKANVGGGISGRCRATGALLLNTGSAASTLTIKQLGSRPAIGQSANGAAALSLPNGTATASYCAVMAIYMGVDSKTGTAVTNWLNTIKSNTLLGTMARTYSQVNSTNTDLTVSCGGDSGSPIASVPNQAAGTWGVVVADWNDDTGIVSLSLNGGAYVTATKTTKHLVDANTAVTIGYPLTASSLRDSGVGDLYLFSASQLASSYGKGRIADLVAALKSQYGVA